jgi:uncharacterized MAPEG superfamily protein
MNLSENYLSAFWGITAIIAVLFIQWIMASKAKGSQKGAIPGKIDPSLGHESFIFRAHRTFMNTLENIPAMLGTSFLAILIGADPFWTMIFIWIFVVGRIIHMTLYYVIATEKNPSPRTYFFTIGLIANLALFVLCVKTLTFQ